MIKANELRIGNWLMDYYGKYKQVAYVGETVGLTNECGGTDKYQKNPMFSYDLEKNLHGIPLTPDILEKCGFTYKKPGGAGGQDEWAGSGFWYPPQNGFNESVYFRGSYKTIKDVPLNIRLAGFFNTQVQYLHQLQNLYFALTGQEININLDPPYHH